MKMIIMGFFPPMPGELFIKSFVYPTKTPLTGKIEYVNSEARVRLYAYTNQLILKRNSG